MVYTLRALFVGINEYDDSRLQTGETKLSFARADAEEMARVFGLSNAFQVGTITLLTDKRATYEAVWHSLHEVFPSHLPFDSETISLFYFAGHGLLDSADDKQVLLGCRDVNYNSPGQGGINLNYISNLLINSSAGCSIAIIDSCYSGGLIDIGRIIHESPIEQARKAIWLSRGADKKIVAIYAACTSHQQSLEKPYQQIREDQVSGHGVYTHELLRGLRDGEARNNDGIVNLNGLKEFLEQRFEKYKEINQEPAQEVIGKGVLPLYHHTPRTGDASQHPVEVLEPPRSPYKITRDNTLPPPKPGPVTAGQMAGRRQQLRKLAIPVIIAIAALLACGLLTTFVEPLQTGFFGLVFALGILLALCSFRVGRVVGAILAPVQLLLLIGFAYDHFHWGSSISALTVPFTFIAGLEWLVWTLIIIELLLTLLYAYGIINTL